MAKFKTIHVREETRTSVSLSYPRSLDAPNNPAWVEFDGPLNALRFPSLDALDDWLTGLRHDTDVLLERRNRANQATLDGAA